MDMVKFCCYFKKWKEECVTIQSYLIFILNDKGKINIL